MKEQNKQKQPTSWQKVHEWYADLVGPTGHYYHQSIILPKMRELLDLQDNSTLLDLACGQGVLTQVLPQKMTYVGIDAAKGLIAQAIKKKSSSQQFIVADITKPLPLPKEKLFTHATIILALQNIDQPQKVFAHIRPHLQKNARFVIVMNHPCFRIPRQSHWGIDEASKTQYRRIDVYMSEQKIPIHTHPSKGQQAETTWSFHHPLSSYSRWLKDSGFVIESIEEWCSDKVSTGGKARMENRARKEIPLFLALVARAC